MVNFELADGRYTGLCVMFENGNGYEETYRDMMLNRDQLDKILDQVVKTAEDLNASKSPLDLHDGVPHSIVELENKCNDMVRLRFYESRKPSYDNIVKSFREGLDDDPITKRAWHEILQTADEYVREMESVGWLEKVKRAINRERVYKEKVKIGKYLDRMGYEATEDFRREFNGGTGGRFKEPFEKEYADALKSEIKVDDMVKALYLRETYEDVAFFEIYKLEIDKERGLNVGYDLDAKLKDWASELRYANV